MFVLKEKHSKLLVVVISWYDVLPKLWMFVPKEQACKVISLSYSLLWCASMFDVILRWWVVWNIQALSRGPSGVKRFMSGS